VNGDQAARIRIIGLREDGSFDGPSTACKDANHRRTASTRAPPGTVSCPVDKSQA
jgi:hypothetical protein